MKKIFAGLVFSLLNINIIIGESAAELAVLPDFVGYLLILAGAKQLADESNEFSAIKPFCSAGAVIGAALFVLSLLGQGSDGGAMTIAMRIMAAAETVLSLYVSYRIICGVEDIEKSRAQKLGADKLRIAWKFSAVGIAAAYIMYLVPVVSSVGILVNFAFSLVLLWHFYHTASLYEQK